MPQEGNSFDERASLLAFLAHRDHPCPICGYNLRSLSNPSCPECGNPLHLTVGSRPLPVHLLLLAIVPLAFSGIFGTLMLLVLMVQLFRMGMVYLEGEGYFWLGAAVVAAVVGLLVFVMRNRFLRMARERQAAFAAIVWLLHGLALCYLLSQMLG